MSGVWRFGRWIGPMLAGASLSLSGCGAQAPSNGPSGEDAASVGQLNVDLAVGDSVVLAEVHYEISGNGFYKSGTANVLDSRTLKLQVGGIPRGNDYVVKLRATDARDPATGDAAAKTQCAGEAHFDIAAGKTSTARVHLQCRLPKPGSVLITGDLNVCPLLDAVTALPSEVTVGHSVNLVAQGRDTDNLPEALRYTWSTSSGVLSTTGETTARLQCTEPGAVTVTATVTDGDCAESSEVSITCSEPLAEPDAGPSSSGGDTESGDATSSEASSVPTSDDTSTANGSDGTTSETSGDPTSTGDTGATSSDETSSADTGSEGTAILSWNEVESNGGTPDDWVELFNSGNGAQDLSGWTFKDNDDTHVYTIPSGTIILPGQYLILENFGFGLGSGDSARLFDPSGVLVLSYTWQGHAVTTYGRCPDITGAWSTTTASTKGAANDCSPIVVFNEVESSGGAPGDWVELYNAGYTAADLSGYIFKDNDDSHAFPLPAGTVIPVGGYLVLDEAAFGFGLGGADSVRLFTPNGVLVAEYSWSAHASATTYGRCPDVSGAFTTTTSSTKGAPNDCALGVRLNEIESSGGTPGDWVELFNAGSSAADLSGWVFKDNDDSHAYVVPPGTSIGAGSFLVLEESAFGFGLGGGDSVRLYDAQGALVDSHTYVEHAPITYGRCPDGSGDFAPTTASTKGVANACVADPDALAPWPGLPEIGVVDEPSTFSSNLSGLHYQPGLTSAEAVLWATLNGPSKLYRMVAVGDRWLPAPGEWSEGKLLTYPDGLGQPDSEGVTKAEWDGAGIYVATERNNEVSGTSRLSVLRYDETSEGSTLVATHEWNLTGQLPAVGANAGLEAITWIPDSTLLAAGFRDEFLGVPYEPTTYPDHGTGLFVVGVEGTGDLHVLALNHADNTTVVVATFNSGNPTVMSLEFDRDAAVLWAGCDNSCNNELTWFMLDTTAGSPTAGAFAPTKRIAPPSGLPNTNNEGIAFAPAAECNGGARSFFWSDDNDLDGHALRRGALACAL